MTYINSKEQKQNIHPYDVRRVPMPVEMTVIDAAPTVQVCISRSWVKHLDGVLERLLWRDAWDGTDTQIDFSIQQVRQLLAALASNDGCEDITGENVATRFRFTEDCEYQYQNYNPDTGAIIVNWTDVEGWETNGITCLKGEQGIPGIPGQNAVGISGWTVDADGTITINLTDGTQIIIDPVVQNIGKVVQSVAKDAGNDIIVTYTDGTTVNIGKLASDDCNCSCENCQTDDLPVPDDTEPDAKCNSAWYAAERLTSFIRQTFDAAANQTLAGYIESLLNGDYVPNPLDAFVEYVVANGNPLVPDEVDAELSVLAEMFYCADFDKGLVLSAAATHGFTVSVEAAVVGALNATNQATIERWAYTGRRETGNDCTGFCDDGTGDDFPEPDANGDICLDFTQTPYLQPDTGLYEMGVGWGGDWTTYQFAGRNVRTFMFEASVPVPGNRKAKYVDFFGATGRGGFDNFTLFSNWQIYGVEYTDGTHVSRGIEGRQLPGGDSVPVSRSRITTDETKTIENLYILKVSETRYERPNTNILEQICINTVPDASNLYVEDYTQTAGSFAPAFHGGVDFADYNNGAWRGRNYQESDGDNVFGISGTITAFNPALVNEVRFNYQMVGGSVPGTYGVQVLVTYSDGSVQNDNTDRSVIGNGGGTYTVITNKTKPVSTIKITIRNQRNGVHPPGMSSELTRLEISLEDGEVWTPQ